MTVWIESSLPSAADRGTSLETCHLPRAARLGPLDELGNWKQVDTLVSSSPPTTSSEARSHTATNEIATIGTGSRFYDPNGKPMATECAAGRGVFVDNVSNLTGSTASARNRAIDACIKEEVLDLKLAFQPKYSPEAGYGMAKNGVGTRIGPESFGYRSCLRDTIVHEELHHRWWERGIFDHHPSGSLKEDQFYRTLDRYSQMGGWKD